MTLALAPPFFRFSHDSDSLERFDFEEHGKPARLLLRPYCVEKLIGDPPRVSRVGLPGKSGVGDTPGRVQSFELIFLRPVPVL